MLWSPSTAAVELLTVQLPQQPIQQHHIFKLRVESNQSIKQLNYPLQLQLTLINGRTHSDHQQQDILRWEDLSQGFDLHCSLSDNILDPKILADIRLIDGHKKTLFDQRYTITTITSIKQRFNQLVNKWRQQTQPTSQHALQQLRLEQLAILLRAPLRNAEFKRIETYLQELEGLAQIRTSVTQWPQLLDRAFTQRCDHSAQPLRLFIPSHKPRALIIAFRHYQNTPNKAQWPSLPSSYLAFAQQEQCAVLDIYPAGDTNGDGMYGLRCADALKQCFAVQKNLRDIPHLILAEGNGCRAALNSILNQDLAHSHAAAFIQPHQKKTLTQKELTLLNGMAIGFSDKLPHWGSKIQAHRRLAEQHAFIRAGLGTTSEPKIWQWLKQQAVITRAPPAAQEQLHSLGQRPLLCVVGAGEHLQAKQHISDMQQSLQAAWAQHCQAQLPIIADEDFNLADYPGHDLIFLGNPFDNQALAQLLPSIPRSARPLDWDERHLRYPSGQALRSQVLQLRWHLIHKQRHIWILDGPALRFAQGPLPLQGWQSGLDIREAGRVWSAD